MLRIPAIFAILIAGCDAPASESTAEETTEGAEAIAENGDLLIRLQAEPGGAQADADFGALGYMLAADAVVVGAIENAQPDGSATFRVREVLRGDPAQIRSVNAGGEYSGCEGNPDFASLAGREIAMFLRRSPDGSLRPLHGASGLHTLPYRELLSLDQLREIVQGRAAPPPVAGSPTP